MAKVLIVHQSEGLANFLRDLISKENGHEVDVVESYEEGVSRVWQKNFDVVFVQGSQIWTYGRGLVAQARCPVVMVSGGGKNYRKLARQTGCVGFIAIQPGRNVVGKLSKLLRKYVS